MKRNLFKSICFVLSLVLGLFLLTKIVTPKRVEFPFDTDLKMQGFYDEPENSLDIVFIGSSHLYFGVNPNVIYENNGLLTYNLGMNEQPTWISYYYLKEVLKYQKPKVVVLETFYLENTRKFDEHGGFASETVNRINLDPLKFSLNKLSAIENCVPEKDVFDYVFPLSRYHDRWKRLYEIDFSNNKVPYLYKGFTSSLKVYKETRVRDWGAKKPIDGVVLHHKSVEYVDKIIQLANENDIKLIFIKTPLAQAIFRQEFVDALNSIKKYANKNEIDFIDYNQIYNHIGFDFLKHMSDESGHVNKYGAEIISKHLGGYLEKHFFPKKKFDPITKISWDKNLKKYKKEEFRREAQLKIKKSKTLQEYLNYAKALDFLVLVSVFDDGSGQYRNYHKTFSEIGLTSELNKKFRWSYLGMKNNKTGYVKEIVDSVAIENEYEIGKLDISMYSVGGNKAGNRSSIKINGKEYSKNKRGHNFVIVNLKDETVFDTFNVDTHGDNKLTIRR